MLQLTSPKLRTLRVFVLAGLLILSRGSAAAQKPSLPPAAAESSVTLSPFEVRAETVEFNEWSKVSSPHYFIYTDASTKEAVQLIRQMEMLHQAIPFYLKRRQVKAAPLTFVMPTKRSDWKKIQNRGAVEWEVATTMIGSVRSLVLVEYDWQNEELSTIWSMLAARCILDMNLEGPLWFRSGLRSFFSSARFKNDSLTLGKQGADAFWLRSYEWMEWSRFFKITRDSPEYTKDTNDHSIWSAQSAVLAHYVLTHAEPEWTKRYLTWSSYLNGGNEPTAAAFKEVFTVDWATLQNQIVKMLDGGKYTTGTIQFPPGALQFTVATGTPSTREMRELFVLGQIMNQKNDESLQSLDAILQRGLKTEALRDLLVSACDAKDRTREMVDQLRLLIAAGSDNPRVYSQAAEGLLHLTVGTPTLDSRIGTETDELRSWCNRALELEPLEVRAIQTLAWTEALSADISKASVETITRLCRSLEGNAATDYALVALAVARMRTGNEKRARNLAERVYNSPYSRPSSKKIAAAIMQMVPTAGAN